MSIIDQQNDLESFSDDMLAKEAQSPSGQYPLFLLVSEIERRKNLRQRYEAQAYKAGTPSVLEQRIQEMQGQGIPSVDQGMQQPGPPNPQMQQGIMGMAAGGMVGYQNGGTVDPDPWWKRVFGSIEFQPSAGIGFVGQTPSSSAALEATSSFDARPPDMRSAYRQAFGPNWRSVIQEREQSTMTPEEYRAYMTEPRGDRREIRVRDPWEGLDFVGAELSERDPARDIVMSRLEALAGGADIESDLATARSANARAADLMRSGVRDSSEYERLLQEHQMSPKEIRDHKLALAASGLGALISGARGLGDVGVGMGGLTRELLSEGERMEKENQAMALEAAKAAEAREDRNLSLLTGAEQATAQSARDIAQIIVSNKGNTVQALNAMGNLLNSDQNRDIAVATLKMQAIEFMNSYASQNRLTMQMLNGLVGNLQASLNNLMEDSPAYEAVSNMLREVAEYGEQLLRRSGPSPSGDEGPSVETIYGAGVERPGRYPGS